MSSRRGRKRNDSLPPNRSREVQRAFWARRAAHLQALEQRVAELEEENGRLQQALNLSPSKRIPLGRGPTGRDKPSTPTAGGSDSQTPSTSASREPSITRSPGSRINPPTSGTVDTSVPSRLMQVTKTGPSWNGIPTNGERHTDAPDPRTPLYQPTPMMAPLPLKLSYSFYQRDQLSPSSSRKSESTDVYMRRAPTAPLLHFIPPSPHTTIPTHILKALRLGHL